MDSLIELLKYNINFLNENEINSMVKFKNIELNLNNKIIRIDEKDFNKITSEYILNALIIYEIDTI